MTFSFSMYLTGGSGNHYSNQEFLTHDYTTIAMLTQRIP